MMKITATAQDSAQVTFTDLPSAIAVIKSADQTLIPKTGADVAYTVTVANLERADVVTITSLIDSAFGDLTDRQFAQQRLHGAASPTWAGATPSSPPL
ncbi:MAG: hypothetical protein R2911_22980 [Caldilineaceae bacterium]